MRDLWILPLTGAPSLFFKQVSLITSQAGGYFKDRSPALRTLFDAFVAALQTFGPVTILPEKTRIAFQVRMSFAQLTPRNWRRPTRSETKSTFVR